MVRRGRSASPPPAQRRNASTAHVPPRNQHVPARAAPPPPAPVQTAPAVVIQPQQPSTFQHMAATAGGVAVGSAVGHTIGQGITSLFSGSGQKEAAAPAPANVASPQQCSKATQDESELQGPCAFEMKEFLKCAENQSDLTLCAGFNEAMRQCKARHNLQ